MMPATATSKPMPATISFAPSRVITSENGAAMIAPIRRAAMQARSHDCVADETTSATKAPASIMASTPMFTRPPIRFSIPPMAVSRSGVVTTKAELRMASIICAHPLGAK